MDGYATLTRVSGGRVRALAWEGRPATDDDDAPRITPAVHGRVEDPDAGIPFAERVERFRDQLSMMTFFVTDPESWR